MRMTEDVRALEAVGKKQGFVVQDGPGWAVGHDPASVEDNHTLADFDNQFQIVGSDDSGVIEGLQELDQTAAGTRVEV